MAQMRILYFAWLREAIGCDAEEVDLPSNCTSPRDVAQWLAMRGGGYATAFADFVKIRVACDHVMADLDAPFGSAREMAFFPPVTGG